MRQDAGLVVVRRVVRRLGALASADSEPLAASADAVAVFVAGRGGLPRRPALGRRRRSGLVGRGSRLAGRPALGRRIRVRVTGRRRRRPRLRGRRASGPTLRRRLRGRVARHRHVSFGTRVELGCRPARRSVRRRSRQSLTDLGTKHRLELGRDLAPRVGRAGWSCRVARTLIPVFVATTAALTLAGAAAGAGAAAADIGIAVDAAAATPAVALPLDGRLVGGPAATRTTAPTTLPTGCTAARTATLFRDQVFRDLRLVEVLVIGDRGQVRGRRNRRPELRIPDRPERCRPRSPGSVDRLVVLLVDRLEPARSRRRLRRCRGRRTCVVTSATSATAATAAAPTSAPAIVKRLGVAFGSLGTFGAWGAQVVEREHLGGRELGFGQAAGLRQALAGECGETVAPGAVRRCCGRRTPAATTPRRCGDGRLGLAGPTATPAARRAAAAADARPFGLLVGDLGHRQVGVVAGHAPARARALLDTRELGDVGELVGDLDQVGRGVAAEADDLAADAHLLDGPDGRGEVTVARHDDGDVQVPRGLHHVDDELDVEVGLDLAVAVLADVLADDLVAVPAQEVMEVPLVLVVRVEARVCIGAHEVASGRGRLEERDVIDVHAGGLGRIEDVRHVHEDGDVLAQTGTPLELVVDARPARSRCAAGPMIRSGARCSPPRPRFVGYADRPG